ncbi:hypothetical protein [Xanthomarina gelatinilytica]|uniref:hypothetical protein n=1 Tax=Xanthomarina gelatinilytica TaxID=1137281 RepID=UPI003AA95539
MIGKLKQYFLFGNIYYGAEHAVVDNKETILLFALKKKKRQLDIHFHKKLDSLDNISIQIPKGVGISLVINNDKVLSKKVLFSKDEDSKIIQNAYPNINIHEFYYDILKQKNACFITICRKEYVDTLIEDYRKKNLYIIHVSFGNHVLNNIREFIGSNEVYTTNALVEIDKEGLNEIFKQSDVKIKEYDINGLKVANAFLLSFAAILNVILPKKKNGYSNFDSNHHVLLTDFQQQRFFSQFLKVGLLFFLIILFINFFIFNHYFNKVSELRQTSQVNETSKQQLISLKENVDKKEKFINDILKSESSKSSFYTNAIMVSLPESISISEFNFQPLIKRIKAEKPIEYEPNILLLKGVSTIKNEISHWISELEVLDWVEKIVITDYSESNKTFTDFSLNITIK